jgi:hypothetical protein
VASVDLAIWAVVAPLVVAIVQVCKQAGLPSRWAGVAALAAGTLCGGLARLAGVGGGPLAAALLTGAIAGLSAAGAWSGARAASER